jgi:hypothetical protein
MKKIIVPNQQEQRISIPNGRVMTVSPGRIQGLFSLEKFADPACCSEDEGFSKLTFVLLRQQCVTAFWVRR